MSELELKALAALRLDWAPAPDDVWRTSPYHIEELNRESMDLILAGYEDARISPDANPIGVALLGPRGTGKTHLLSVVREHVQSSGGYFFLVGLLDPSVFWHSTLLFIRDGLIRRAPGGQSQVSLFVERLADMIDAPRAVRRGVTGDAELGRASLDAFVDLLRKYDPQLDRFCLDTARVLVMLGSGVAAAEDVAHTFLSSNDEEEPGERAAWGIRRAKRTAQEIVRDLSRLLALTGPTVIAVDQIDALLRGSVSEAVDRSAWNETILLSQIAGGLMSLRQLTRRTLTVVSFLPSVWVNLQEATAADTVGDRFRTGPYLGVLGSADLAQAFLERRLAPVYASVGFLPPYPSWPVAPSVFVQAVDSTPRELLMLVDLHVRACLRAGAVTELTTIAKAEGVGKPLRTEAAVVPAVEPDLLSATDARYFDLRNAARAAAALDPATEDDVVPALLAAGFDAWTAEQGPSGTSYSQDPPPGPRPALHAKLIRSIDAETQSETHWAFRAIGASHAIAATNRLRNAMTVSGLTEGVAARKLFILRTADWPNGPRTAELTSAFEKSGGVKLDFPASDVVILMALKELQAETDPVTFRAWCLGRQPTRAVSFLQAALSHADEEVVLQDEDDEGTTESWSSSDGAVVPLGMSRSGELVEVELKALRKHAAVFAGSGSGKTVFIRRLVEECALLGVSSIVIDLNNDLARLGDAWPQAPESWGSGDQEKAKEYLDSTEVVVWTPGWEGGRPLSFQPLPDFASIMDNNDEFRQGVEAAVAALVPRARADARAGKSELFKAVLREALTHYAQRGGSDLREFVAMLDELPEGVSRLNGAEKMAKDMAQTLLAAMVNDPLFGGGGESADPGMLLRPSNGRRARISVISFVGLPHPDQQQSFINQLQLALFSWIKRHPAGERPLGGLLVMDEAQNIAPSRGMTACTQSTLALASQARKYGLGLVFATQAPKGLHNGIPGNSATQLFGLLNSPAHIAAAREIAKAKGGDVPDIARLETGQFYAAVAGGEFKRIQSPLCLSYHPSSPLTTEEVVDRARG